MECGHRSTMKEMLVSNWNVYYTDHMLCSDHHSACTNSIIKK